MIQTNKLRWITRKRKAIDPYDGQEYIRANTEVLQQWFEYESGERPDLWSKGEWRDIPIEKEDE